MVQHSIILEQDTQVILNIQSGPQTPLRSPSRGNSWIIIKWRLVDLKHDLYLVGSLTDVDSSFPWFSPSASSETFDVPRLRSVVLFDTLRWYWYLSPTRTTRELAIQLDIFRIYKGKPHWTLTLSRRFLEEVSWTVQWSHQWGAQLLIICNNVSQMRRRERGYIVRPSTPFFFVWFMLP